MDWMNDSGMVSVLLRHYPELKPAFRGVANPFAPWSDVAVPLMPTTSISPAYPSDGHRKGE